jgi:hypothetical protein
LALDLPSLPDATALTIEEFELPIVMRYRTASDIESVIDFYRAELTALAWFETNTVIDSQQPSLSFEREQMSSFLRLGKAPNSLSSKDGQTQVHFSAFIKDELAQNEFESQPSDNADSAFSIIPKTITAWQERWFPRQANIAYLLLLSLLSFGMIWGLFLWRGRKVAELKGSDFESKIESKSPSKQDSIPKVTPFNLMLGFLFIILFGSCGLVGAYTASTKVFSCQRVENQQIDCKIEEYNVYGLSPVHQRSITNVQDASYDEQVTVYERQTRDGTTEIRRTRCSLQVIGADGSRLLDSSSDYYCKNIATGINDLLANPTKQTLSESSSNGGAMWSVIFFLLIALIIIWMIWGLYQYLWRRQADLRQADFDGAKVSEVALSRAYLNDEELPPDYDEDFNIRRQQIMEEPIGQSISSRGRGSLRTRTTRKEGLNFFRMFLLIGVIIVYFLAQMLRLIITDGNIPAAIITLIMVVAFGFGFVVLPVQEIFDIMAAVPQKPRIFPKGLRLVKVHFPFWQKFLIFLRKDLGSWLPGNQTTVELAREPLYPSQRVELHVEHQTKRPMAVKQLKIQLIGIKEWEVPGNSGDTSYEEELFCTRTLFERHDFVIEAGAPWQQRLEMIIPHDAKPTINSPEDVKQRRLWAIRVHIQPRQGDQITERFPFRVKTKP